MSPPPQGLPLPTVVYDEADVEPARARRVPSKAERDKARRRARNKAARRARKRQG